jgi:hypothetical protein
MKVTSLTLHNYLLFKDSDIKTLIAKFEENIQIIIGSNGSGKSSLLFQISTIPPRRSMFGKEGSKILTVEKDGVEYRLVSDYIKPSSPHAFYIGEDDTNHNTGSTTETQKELIEYHLGITPLLDNLIMNRFIFPKMTQTERRKFLFDTNPDKIGFIIPLIKQTQSKIKACKNNLARLEARKIIVEQDLLTGDRLEETLANKERISQTLLLYQSLLLDIDVGLRTLALSGPRPVVDTLALRKRVRSYKDEMASLRSVERDDGKRAHIREETLTRRAIAQDRCQDAEQETERLTTILGDLETKYRDLSSDGDLGEIDSTISRLEVDKDKHTVPKPPLEVSREDLVRYRDELPHLQHRLSIFTDRTVPLYSRRKRQHRQQLLQNCQYRLQMVNRQMHDLATDEQSLRSKVTIKPRDIPDSPCAKDRCPLYAHFMEDYQSLSDKLLRIGQATQRLTHRKDRLEILMSGLSDYLTQSQPYADTTVWLVNQRHDNPLLNMVLKQSDLIQTLSNRPNQIARALTQAYDHIEHWLRLKDIESDLATAYALKAKCLSSGNGDTIRLIESIHDTKDHIHTHRHKLVTESYKCKTYDKILADIDRYNDLRRSVEAMMASYTKTLTLIADHHEKDRLTLLQRHLEAERSVLFVQMSEIERILRDQSVNQSRYDEEIVGQITLITQEMEDLIQIEKALIAIPKENMVSFINTIFDQTNRLIKSIWTIPLSINLVSAEDVLDYSFTVSGDNGTQRELGECSDGQNEILTFAFNLALRIILKQFDYPLCCDELGRTFDEVHRHNLTLLLKRLLDDRIISQLFLINHNADIHGGFIHAETIVLRQDNILLPPVFNQNVTIV